jgi:hypothetical protein
LWLGESYVEPSAERLRRYLAGRMAGGHAVGTGFAAYDELVEAFLAEGD